MFSTRVPRIMAVDGDSAHLLKMSDGRQALDYLLRQDPYTEPKSSLRPDLVLLDISIPIIDGYGVFKAIRNSQELRLAPVIVLTSTNSQEEINRAYAIGVNGYGEKRCNRKISVRR